MAAVRTGRIMARTLLSTALRLRTGVCLGFCRGARNGLDQREPFGLMAHCERKDEYIVGWQAHTYEYEGGGAWCWFDPLQPIDGEADGSLDPGRVGRCGRRLKADDFTSARPACWP